MHFFTEARVAVDALANFVPWSAGEKSDVFHINQGDYVKTFGPLRFTPTIASVAQAKCEGK